MFTQSFASNFNEKTTLDFIKIQLSQNIEPGKYMSTVLGCKKKKVIFLINLMDFSTRAHEILSWRENRSQNKRDGDKENSR